MTHTEKKLYHTKEELIISKTRLFTGVGIGLFFSFWFYGFLYMSREVFRFFSRTEYYDLLILSDKEIFFYNLFFAFIAVIFGQSICFNYWFQKPRTIFHGYNWRRISIVNDNRVLNWNFLSWFSKLAIVYGLFFCMTFAGGFYDFVLFPDYAYLFVLVIVVLYLQVWNSFRQKFRKQSRKWLLISVLVVSTVSLTFSRINFVDHKTMDINFLQNNIFLRYNLEIPTSDYYSYGIERKSLTTKIFVVMTDVDGTYLKPQIIYNNKNISLHKIDSVVNNWRLTRHPAEAVLIDVRLHIDKNVPMAFVSKLKEKLSETNFRRVSFVVFPSDLEIKKLFEYYYSLSAILPPNGEDGRAFADSLIKIHNIGNVIKIRTDYSGEYFFNGIPINKTDIGIQIENILRTNMKSAFHLYYSGETSYSDYIFMLSQARKATYKIRNELALKEYGVPFDELYISDEFYEIIEKYPALVFDFLE